MSSRHSFQPLPPNHHPQHHNHKSSSSLPPTTYYTVHVGLNRFHIDSRYVNLCPQGDGSYGFVARAYDSLNSRMVAIKKVKDTCSNLTDAKRILRELKLLRHLKSHENIVAIYDIMTDPPNSPNFRDIYIVTNLFESDLERIIVSKQSLTDHHHKYFLYQILRALKYVHSANILHRDLKPSNLLVNANCDLALCDFGLSRGFAGSYQDPLTEYVVTRWYRAPELLCENKYYGKAVDIWSVGCVFAELITGMPFFRGDNPQHQLHVILSKLGCPPKERLDFIQNKTAANFVLKYQHKLAPHFSLLFPQNTSFLALDLLKKLLEFHPDNRITVEEALQHPYLKDFHGQLPEPSCAHLFNFDFELPSYIRDNLTPVPVTTMISPALPTTTTATMTSAFEQRTYSTPNTVDKQKNSRSRSTVPATTAASSSVVPLPGMSFMKTLASSFTGVNSSSNNNSNSNSGSKRKANSSLNSNTNSNSHTVPSQQQQQQHPSQPIHDTSQPPMIQSNGLNHNITSIANLNTCSGGSTELAVLTNEDVQCLIFAEVILYRPMMFLSTTTTTTSTTSAFDNNSSSNNNNALFPPLQAESKHIPQQQQQQQQCQFSEVKCERGWVESEMNKSNNAASANSFRQEATESMLSDAKCCDNWNNSRELSYDLPHDMDMDIDLDMALDIGINDQFITTTAATATAEEFHKQARKERTSPKEVREFLRDGNLSKMKENVVSAFDEDLFRLAQVDCSGSNQVANSSSCEEWKEDIDAMEITNTLPRKLSVSQSSVSSGGRSQRLRMHLRNLFGF